MFQPGKVPIGMDAQPIRPKVDRSQFTQPIPRIKKGGMFGSGLGFGEVIAHGLMGAAAGMGNTAPLQSYMSLRRDEQDREDGLAGEQRDFERQKELALYRAQLDQQYATPQPKFWERNDGSLMGLGPDGKPHVIYQDPNAGYTDPRTGIFTPFPQNAPAIGSVVPDPRKGGSSGNAGRGF